MIDQRDKPMAEDSDSQYEDAMARQMRKARGGDGNDDLGEEDQGEDMMEEMRGGSDINEWLKEKRTIQFVRNSFGRFLRNFKDDRGVDIYEERISDMCTNNK